MSLIPASPPVPLTLRRIVWGTLALVLVAFSFWLLYRFNRVFFYTFIAIVLGTVLRPIVTWLFAHRVPRVAGSILVYLLLLLLLTGFLLLLFPMIAEESGKISVSIPEYYQSFRLWMIKNSNFMLRQLAGYLPIKFSLPTLTQPTGQQVLDTAGQMLNFINSAAKFIFSTTAVLLLSFYWTLYGTKSIQSLLLLIPKDKREDIAELITAMETKVGFFIAGQGVLCLIIGVLALILYLLIGLPNPFVLALIAGIMEAVPMVGPILGAIPAGIIALSIDPSKLIWVVLGTLVIQQLEGSLLVPRIMRRAVGVNPFVSLLSIFAFSSFFGVAGALMAIPIAAIIQLLFDRFLFQPSAKEPEASSERDFASRLRYEAQDLVLDLRKQARLSKDGSDLEVKQIDHVMDEIESITTDLDTLLSEINTSGDA